MICVYSSGTTTFTNNGLAVLEPTLCELTMTINGAWTLTLEHPYDTEGKYLNLEKGNIIKVTDIGILRGCDTTQRYRIYDTVKGLSSMKVIALPVGMEATYDAIIEELNIKAKTGNQAVALISSYLTNHGVSKYTLTASGLSKKRTTKYKNTNLIAALCGSDDGSIVNKYGAEVAYNNYQIFVKSHIGNTTPQYDVRIGKNLTGLSYDTDDSEVVTRLYPISDDDIRYNSFDTGTSGNKSYYDAENINEYPFIRAAFVDAPYSLIDTDISDENPYKTDTTDLTEEIYNTVYNDGEAAIQAFWADVCTDNVFEYTHESETSVIYLIPEFVQDVIRDISATIAENVLNDAGVIHEGLRSWLTKAIRASMEWVVDVDLPAKGWIENQDGSYSYGTELRKLKNEWAYVDRKMSYFDNNEKWAKEKDDTFEWDWVQKKGQRQKYGNNKRYLARNTYVYDYDGGCKYYWFDEEGWWDGSSESSGWAWHQDSTGWWFGDADPDGDESKYIHDDWAFIRETADSPRKLYYFNSDGYLDGEEVVDWNWHKVNGKWYFGSTDHEKRAIYLTSQWMKIDGDYRCFDSDGYVIDLKDTMMGLAEVLSFYLSNVLIDAIQGGQNDLYNCLYAHMKDYCDDLYDNGLCNPAINVSIDFVDLSMTEEYKDFSDLEKVCLGDKVKVVYNLYGNTQYSIEEYVKGLTYDCIRGYNTKIEVGGVSSVTSLFDTSVKGTGNEQRLVAGENVTINGNVINVSANTGDVYAGDRVSVTQLQTTGQPIAKIYVNGTPTTIYAVGSDVEVTPIKTSGDKIATITVGGVNYDIYADTGLKYWVETQTDIYREGSHTETTYNNSYYFDTQVTWQTRSGHSYHGHWDFKKANDIPAYIGKVATGEEKYFILVSENEDGVDWLVNDVSYQPTGYGEPPIGEYPLEYKHTGNITYEGKTYYYSVGRYYYDNPHTETDNFEYVPGVNAGNPYSDMARAIIDATEITTTIPDIFGVSNNPNDDKILWYSSNGTHASHTDDVFITKEGVFNGTEFRINGQTIGGFYKTTLYQGNTYSASISLSDSYRDYDLLMIETYNQDDKNNYASMVSVADLSTGSYIGVSGYLMYTIANARSLTFHEAPDDNNHSRYIKAVYGFRTTHDSGTVPPLEDVVVDGVSVVSGGVATINNKQNKLTAGANITINNDVISASGTSYTAGANVQISQQNVISATDTTYDDFDGTNSGLVPEPQSGDSGYLKSDGTWAEPEGTTVVANPSGTATDKLTKIQVDNTIYEIEGGGSGGGSRTLLYSGSAATGAITLSESYENFDYLYVVAYAVGEITALVDTERLGYDIGAFTLSECSGVSPSSVTGGDMYVELVVTSPTVLTITNPYGGIVIKKIYGITGLGGGASALDDLTDVNITSLANGQVLTYDSTSQKWVNATPSGGGSRDYYLHNGNIGGGASASAYPTVNLDKPLTEGLYLAVVNDTEDWHTGAKWFHWGNNTTSKQLVVGGSSGNIVFTIDNTNETVTTTQYSGNWRDIFLSIIKVDI